MNILVIEDEPDIRKNLEYNLSREGFKVSTAGSLKDGLKSLDSNTYSLILLDLNLPRKNGLEVLEYISGEKDHTLNSVIMISGEFDEGTIKKAVDIGGRCFLAKPFSKDLVVDKIRKHVVEKLAEKKAS